MLMWGELDGCNCGRYCSASGRLVGRRECDQLVGFELSDGDQESLVGCACDESLSGRADEYLFSSQSVKSVNCCVSGSTSVMAVSVISMRSVNLKICSLYLCVLVTSLRVGTSLPCVHKIEA